MLSRRACGLLLALSGTLAVSVDALLLRVARNLGGWLWATVLVKALACGLLTLVPAVAVEGRSLLTNYCASPASLSVAMLLQVLVTLGFPVALLETGVARAQLLISLNPLWAALLARWVLGEHLPWRTAAALPAALAAMLLVFLPPLLLGAEARGSHESLGGDVVALATGLSMAAFMTANRWLAQHRPKAPTAVASGLGSLLGGAVVLLPALDGDWRQLGPAFYGVVLLEALVVALVTVLTLVLAPRYISGPEVAIVQLLEVVLAPLWVLVGFGEVPSAFTLAGGASLLATLLVHELVGLRTATKAATTQSSGEEAEGQEEQRPCRCTVVEQPRSEPRTGVNEQV